jgi:hypothetical protein
MLALLASRPLILGDGADASRRAIGDADWHPRRRWTDFEETRWFGGRKN